MPGALFALPCPECGSPTELVVRDTIVCSRCERSYRVKFGHLLETTRIEGRLEGARLRTVSTSRRWSRA